MDENKPRLADIVGPFKLAALAEATGRSRQSVHAWQSGDSLPDVASLPGLSRLLRMSIDELATIIAADAADRELARASVKAS